MQRRDIMSINKDIYNETHDEYMKDDKLAYKDIFDEILNKYMKDDETVDKDICDEIIDEHIEEDKTVYKDIGKKIFNGYIEEDTIINKFSKDTDKKMEDSSHKEVSKISVNCKLKVDFDTKNKMIYLYPGKSQYFTVDVSKSCGDVTIKYKGCYSSKGIRGNLGIYRIVQSGIFVETYPKLDPRKNDFLNFTAIDQCTKECYDFVVVFSCNSCRCCY